MSFAFNKEGPNSHRVAEQRQLLLAAWECAFADKSIVYLSGPLSTGPRFVSWYRQVGRSLQANQARYEREHRRSVVEPNYREIKRLAAWLRASYREPVIEPASLKIAEWSQSDYSSLWETVIERFAYRVVLMPGWQFSVGCSVEVLRAFRSGKDLTTVDGSPIQLDYAIEQFRAAASDLARDNVPVPLGEVASALSRLRAKRRASVPSPQGSVGKKDEVLFQLSKVANVAQFVSFAPTDGVLRQEFSRLIGYAPNHQFDSLRDALGTLIATSAEHTLNIRSFVPEDNQSRPFIYGLKSVDEAVAFSEKLGAQGLHIIANETVNIHDGGVSGVLMGDVIEFAPDDTPRAVEKPGVASLPRGLGLSLLSIVYGFAPELNFSRSERVEFSIHPDPRGWKGSNTLCWELSSIADPKLAPSFIWPNRFSQMIGDKVFGLLIAHLLALPVPRTIVVNRRVAPFVFGQDTGSTEYWTRTSPHEQVPGKFSTKMGWVDPFKLLNKEDPEGSDLASVVCQRAICAQFSGAAIVDSDNHLRIEGVAGRGDRFMRGDVSPDQLPSNVHAAVETLYYRARSELGPVRFEWVFDGDTAWIVQLHKGMTQSSEEWIVRADASDWRVFNVSNGLEELRALVKRLKSGTGLLLEGRVGITSHMADVIRRAGVPARFL